MSIENAENKNITFLENKNIIYIDPRSLVEDNPAVFILNKDTYSKMDEKVGGHFSPEQFDPPQVAWVNTHKGNGMEERKLWIIDGFTRTKFCADHIGQVMAYNPDFRFDSITVNDVTLPLLRNSLIAPEEETQKQESLSVTQYLRAVVPPTIAHQDIASERMAAHFINSWQYIVGEEIAGKYSATASLFFLSNFLSRNFKFDANKFQDALKTQSSFFYGETDDERVKVMKALEEMAGVVIESKLTSESVSFAAIGLVGEESMVIGGSEKSRQQISGLLNSSEFQTKLETYFPDLDTSGREKIKLRFAQVISEKYRRSLSKDKSKINVINEVLKDGLLNIDETLSVITSDNPDQSYWLARKNSNAQRLQFHYLNIVGKKDLNDLERKMIVSLGGKPYLPESHIPGAANQISRINFLINNRLVPFGRALERRKDELLQKGVNQELLDELSGEITEFCESAASRSGTNALSRMGQSMQVFMRDAQEKINLQVNKATILKVAGEVIAPEMLAKYGSRIVLKLLENENGIL